MITEHADNLVSARVCVLGTEPDEAAGGRVRFVLPQGDLCSCTEVKLGGHNPYAPPRKDQPVYIDSLPTDAEELRRSLGCIDVKLNEVSTKTPQGTCMDFNTVANDPSAFTQKDEFVYK